MRRRGFFEERGYLGYLFTRLLWRDLPTLYQRALALLRPTLWIRRLLVLLVRLALLVESGALLLLLSLGALLLLPPLAVLLLVLIPSMLRARALAVRELLPRLGGARVVLLLGQGSEGLAERLSRDGYLPLRILPSTVFARRREGVLSPRLYFSLRRRISRCAERVVCIEFFENGLAGPRSDVL